MKQLLTKNKANAFSKFNHFKPRKFIFVNSVAQSLFNRYRALRYGKGTSFTELKGDSLHF